MPREQIPGWDPIVQLYKDWVQTPPRHGAVVVEVGVAIGRSISWIADWCIANDRRDIEVWAVDPWESSQPGNVRNGEQMELSPDAGGDLTLYFKVLSMYDPKALEFIRPIRTVSKRACRMFADRSVDLCVIDGDHSYEGCLSDIHDWLPRIRPGGYIGGDDHHETDWPGVVRACRDTFGGGVEGPNPPGFTYHDRSYEIIRSANGWPSGHIWRKRVT